LYRFILAEKAHFEVRSMCRVFGVAPSAYYAWEGEQESERARRDGEVLVAIRRIFAQFRGRYGAPRIHRQLVAEGHVDPAPSRGQSRYAALLSYSRFSFSSMNFFSNSIGLT
jgi:hypothetical protein